MDEENKDLNDDKKSADEDEKEKSVSDITIEQFKNALENNLECKSYHDSIVDKTVSKRLDKSIETWKNDNLENLINEEINKRYPQKTDAEIKFEEQQKELEKAMEEKRQLELQIKYQGMMVENNLPIEILEFVAGKDIESTISNIKKFKNLTNKYIQTGIDKEVHNRFKELSYIPGGENGCPGDEAQDLWKMLL